MVMVVAGLMAASRVPIVRERLAPSATSVTPLPALEAERGGRRLPVEGERQQAVGVDEHHQLGRLRFGVRVHPAGGADLGGQAHLDPAARRGARGLERVGVDVELAVPEPVDPPHLGHDRAALLQLGERHEAGHEPRGVDFGPEVDEVGAGREVPAAGARMSRPAKVGPGAGSW